MMNLIPCNQHMVGSFPKLIWELFVFRQKYVVKVIHLVLEKAINSVLENYARSMKKITSDRGPQTSTPTFHLILESDLIGGF